MAVATRILPGVVLSAVIMWPSWYTAEGALLPEIDDWIEAFMALTGNFDQRNASAEDTHAANLTFEHETICKLLPGRTIHERFSNALSTADLLHKPLTSYLGKLFSGGPGCRPHDMPIPGATLHERFLRAMNRSKWPHRLDGFLHALYANEWMQDLHECRMNILLLPLLLSIVMSRLRFGGAFKLERRFTAGREEGIDELASFGEASTGGRNTQGKADGRDPSPGRVIQRSRLTQFWRSSPDRALHLPNIATPPSAAASI